MSKLTLQTLSILSGCFFAFAYLASTRHNEKEAPFRFLLAKYSSRMFLLSFSYVIMLNIGGWLEYSLVAISWKPYADFILAARDHFRSNNYQYFFKYFAAYYYFACLFLLPPYLRYLDSHGPISKDKYASFMKSIVSLANVFTGEKVFWNYTSRLGLLTVCVKFFFAPLLVSWTINNAYHQINLSRSLHWDFVVVNAYLVALFIFIDTLVFCTGYLLELDFLKNDMKSVEPTVLGWVVCLWCYPPFNSFSFSIFDHRIANLQIASPTWVNAMMTAVITLLWGVFAWASLALGWKASNLTNRGIVMKGPYRYVRHPAYTAKLIIWYIQGIFFGQYFLGLLGGFTLIYLLRAWTEERHLSNDPEYREYQKLVRWKLIPGVF